MRHEEARALLGVPESADVAEIQSAFRRRARETHPDKQQRQLPEDLLLPLPTHDGCWAPLPAPAVDPISARGRSGGFGGGGRDFHTNSSAAMDFLKVQEARDLLLASLELAGAEEGEHHRPQGAKPGGPRRTRRSSRGRQHGEQPGDEDGEEDMEGDGGESGSRGPPPMHPSSGPPLGMFWNSSLVWGAWRCRRCRTDCAALRRDSARCICGHRLGDHDPHDLEGRFRCAKCICTRWRYKPGAGGGDPAAPNSCETCGCEDRAHRIELGPEPSARAFYAAGPGAAAAPSANGGRRPERQHGEEAPVGAAAAAARGVPPPRESPEARKVTAPQRLAGAAAEAAAAAANQNAGNPNRPAMRPPTREGPRYGRDRRDQQGLEGGGSARDQGRSRGSRVGGVAGSAAEVAAEATRGHQSAREPRRPTREGPRGGRHSHRTAAAVAPEQAEKIAAPEQAAGRRDRRAENSLARSRAERSNGGGGKTGNFTTAVGFASTAKDWPFHKDAKEDGGAQARPTSGGGVQDRIAGLLPPDDPVAAKFAARMRFLFDG